MGVAKVPQMGISCFLNRPDALLLFHERLCEITNATIFRSYHLSLSLIAPTLSSIQRLSIIGIDELISFYNI